MGYSRSDPHRPCLRERSYGGSEVWFTNFPESEGCFDTLDEDVERALADLRRLADEASPRVDDDSGERGKLR